MPGPATRAIAVIVHALRSSGRVRALPAAAAWLRHGTAAEAGLLRRTAARERHLLPWLAWPAARRLLLGATDLRVPGSSRHLLARKLWFHATARGQIDAGIGQVLCLGAGLDPLGLRLAAECAGVEVVELDLPAPMRAKRTFLAADHPPLHNLHCLDADLGGALPPLPLRGDRPGLVLAEGLFMYLDEPVLRRLLHDLRRRLPGGFELVFSYVSRGRLRDRLSPVARLERLLRRRGEPFRWAIDPADLRAWLAAQGLGLCETRSVSAVVRDYEPGCQGREYGEWVARARSPANVPFAGPAPAVRARGATMHTCPAARPDLRSS